MATIHTIRRKVVNNEYEFAFPHFFEEMANDNITFSDIERAIANGRIHSNLTRDPRGIRYEIIGTDTQGRKIAIICRIKSTGKLLFITTYSVE